MEEKIRVLHVIGKRPLGGIGSFLEGINKFIDKSKFSFDFLINGIDEIDEFDDNVKSFGSNVYILPKLEYKNTVLYFKEMKHFYEKNNEYDIIHIHSVNIAFFNYLFLNKHEKKIKILVHSHSTKYSDLYINGLRNRLLTLPLQYITDLYLACSASAAISIFGKKVVENKGVNIIKNSIETQKFKFSGSVRKEVRSELNVNSRLTIGHVGTFTPVKNHEFIIDIFYELKKINNESILVLVGIGPLENKIRKKVEKLNLADSVKFLGGRRDVNRLMQAFDIFIMPSIFEGVPLVGIEAQAVGVPCILSNTITKEIKVTNLVTFMELNKSSQEWAIKIVENSNRCRSIDTYHSVIDAGHDIKSNVEKLEQIYTSLKK